MEVEPLAVPPTSTPWVPVGPGLTGPAGAAGAPGVPGLVPVAITLPASPTDGQQAILVDSVAVPTYSWLLQWSAAAARWLFVGGVPVSSEVATAESMAVSGASYVDLTTVGPSVTVPRAGTYEVTFGATASPPSSVGFGSKVAVQRGAAATSDGDCVQFFGGNAGGASVAVSMARTIRMSGLAAATVLKLQYGALGGSCSFLARWIKVVPVWVT